MNDQKAISIGLIALFSQFITIYAYDHFAKEEK